MELYIADTLKALRASRGNTQEDLANHLCVSIQAVSKWERGEGLPISRCSPESPPTMT